MRSATEFLADKKKFVQVPHQIVCDDNLTGKEKNVWILLFSFQRKSGSFLIPLREEISNAMGWESTRTVNKYCKRLNNKGYLRYIQKGDGVMRSKVELIYDDTIKKPWNIDSTSNPMYRLNRNVSDGIRCALKENKGGQHWEDLVGYTLNDLKEHLEKQFTQDMDWNNYGNYWHIDHIRPKSTFTFSKPEDLEFKKCWRLSNLQPLEASKNIAKNNKMPCEVEYNKA